MRKFLPALVLACAGLSSPPAAGAQADCKPPLERVDAPIVKAFREAWVLAGGGNESSESVVLLLRGDGCALRPLVLRPDRQYRQMSFRWRDDIIAVVHTHPNQAEAPPQAADRALADHYRVPVFTITMHGMFMYDPALRKTARVAEGIDWIECSYWQRRAKPSER